MGEKTKEELFGELLAEQKTPEEKTETHDQIIRKFQILFANGELFSRIIDSFPYPIAIFTPQYTLALVNRAFLTSAGIGDNAPGKEKIRILRRRINDANLAAAITRVLAGETFTLDISEDPFLMFTEHKQQVIPEERQFTKAVLFPIPGKDYKITHGVLLFLP